MKRSTHNDEGNSQTIVRVSSVREAGAHMSV